MLETQAKKLTMKIQAKQVIKKRFNQKIKLSNSHIYSVFVLEDLNKTILKKLSTF